MTLLSLLPANCRHFFSALLQYTLRKDLQKGKALHSQILKSGSFSSVYLANSLVNFYAKNEDLPKAKLVFETISNKDVVSWNCIINGYSQQGPSNAAFVMGLFQRMRAENTLPNAHTFAGVFTAASHLLDTFSCLQAHSLAIKTASFYDVFVGSSLLNAYCKAGFISDARKVFDRITERNSVTWATMISGYALNGMASDVLGLFKLMCRQGEEVNEFVYTSIFSALNTNEFVECGKQFHCLALKNGLSSFVSVRNSLVTMYAKCGSLDDSIQTFESSGDKNSITWSAIITGYAQSGEGGEALKLFFHMHSNGIESTEFAFVGVINACSDLSAIEEGQQMHAYSLKMGYENQIYIMTALVDMYAKCGRLKDAQKGFNHLQEPDIVLWTSMIGGYAQNGDNEGALSWYCRMQIEGMMPNELTMASVIKACSSLTALDQGKQIHAHSMKYGFSKSLPIGSALLTMYAKCGCLRDGNLIFKRMVKRDIISWNAMMSALSQNGQGREALELFEEMKLEATKPDYVTFVNILSACSHMGMVERGWQYFNSMYDKYGILPRVEHYACMVDILSRSGKLEEAKEFIESASIDHGLCLWRILLGACRNYRNYELGAYAGEKLIELGSEESSTYVLLSSIYIALGKSEEVERVRKMMKLRGVNKEPGCSWIEVKSQVHVFVVGDQMHPEIKDIKTELWRLRKHLKDEGYLPASYAKEVGGKERTLQWQRW